MDYIKSKLDAKFWRCAALAGALAASLSASSEAAGACLPGAFDPTRPPRPGDCYTYSEFNRLMKAEAQQPIFVGNRAVGNLRYGNYFTASADGAKGFNAEMDVGYEEKASATAVTIAAIYTAIKANDVNASSSIPSWAKMDVDEGQAKSYCEKFKGACSSYGSYLKANTLEAGGRRDNRVMMMAQTLVSPQNDGRFIMGKKIVIFRNMETGYGNVADLSATGAITGSFGMRNISPTQFANALYANPTP